MTEKSFFVLAAIFGFALAAYMVGGFVRQKGYGRLTTAVCAIFGGLGLDAIFMYCILLVASRLPQAY